MYPFSHNPTTPIHCRYAIGLPVVIDLPLMYLRSSNPTLQRQVDKQVQL